MSAHVHHFTYGAFNPIAASLLAYLGSFLGLLCTERARGVHSRSRRNRWLVIAAFAIGGGGIWLMHFSAMLGFDVPDSPVRYDLPVTLLSMLFSVATVGIGLMVVGHGKPSPAKIVAAGLLTGGGVLAMHYTGMEGMRLYGAVVHYDPLLVAASALIAIAACTTALWFAISVRGLRRITGAAVVMAIAVCGMHYTGMAAISVELVPGVNPVISGIRPLALIVPITILTAATIVGVALSALQAMTEEEFTDGAGAPKRGAHAETPQPWTLRQASQFGAAIRLSPAARAVAAGRTAGAGRPSPAPRPAPRPPTFDPSVAGAPSPAPTAPRPAPGHVPPQVQMPPSVPVPPVVPSAVPVSPALQAEPTVPLAAPRPPEPARPVRASGHSEPTVPVTPIVAADTPGPAADPGGATTGPAVGPATSGA
ncbi:MHYT domain-containing protein [Actinoplanes sp. NPDC020271]|uniref:MHYT domain-containing protein n=1 Tax=Actinoplanes sp. NPDC020271 TaxID=3363896 RepID=UPI00379267EB